MDLTSAPTIKVEKPDVAENVPVNENPWEVESIYEFYYFNCPTCSYKHCSKQDFVNHVIEIHPESVESLKKICDGSLSNVTIPWEPENDYEYYVQADCGAGGASGWVGPFAFTTACAAFTAPYIEDFSTFTTSTSAFILF